jgi:uncharacterized protein
MILEGLITTTDDLGQMHLAPMGPTMAPGLRSFVLRPFPTSGTYQNLLRHGEGVLHITDDAALIAYAALGQLPALPAHRPAESVQGFVLTDSCRYFEFRVANIDKTQERVKLLCEIVATRTLRDFFGFNRAKHAVLEAAILATRFHLLPPEEIATEFRKLRIIIEKTGAEAEFAAMRFLEAQLEAHREATR